MASVMVMVVYLTLMLAVTVVIWCLARAIFPQVIKKSNKTLPGPISLPFIGAAIQVGLAAGNLTNFELAKKLCAKYGSVMGFQAGMQYFVLVEDFETAKEILNSDDWSGRVPLDSIYFSVTFNKNLGLLMGSGDVWKGSRRFVLRTLRELGFGDLKTMTKGLGEEVEEFLLEFESLRLCAPNFELCLQSQFNLSSLNILWRVMCNQRFTSEDKEMLRLVHLIKEAASLVSVGTQPLFAFPFLRYIPIPGLTVHDKICRLYKELIEFFRKIIDKRREDRNYATIQHDLIDHFLKKIDDVSAEERLNSSMNGTIFSDENLIQCAMDLLVAGVDTTPNTMEFIMLYLLKYPEVQKKVQDEVDQVIGPDRKPNPNDRANMPFTEAVIMEVMRHRSATPINARTSLKHTTLNGCHIPKNTMAGINFVAIHHSEKLWGDPKAFRPERFIDSENRIVRDHKLLAFGAGKRVCLGFTVAKASLFVFLTSLMQKYTFEPSQNYPNLCLDAVSCGITIMPKPYYSKIKIR